MKLLILAPRLPPYYSGTGTVAMENAKGLRALGVDVELACLAEGQAGLDDVDGLRVHRLRAWPRLGNAGKILGLGAVADGRVLHVHLPFIGGAKAAFSAARRSKNPLVATYHQDLQGRGLRGMAFRWYMRHALPRQLRKASKVIVPSLDFARASQISGELLAARIVEVPHGVDTDFFSPGPVDSGLGWPWPASTPTFLFVGALDEAHRFKGLEILFEALRLESRARLVIVGGGPLASTYKAAVRRAGLTERVHFAGILDAPALRAHYRATIATVLPSVSTEMFGMVLVEAMACGRPVVATALPGVRTVVEHGQTGFLVPPGRAQELSGALAACLEGSLGALGRNARLRVEERYARSKVARKLLDVYEGLTSARV